MAERGEKVPDSAEEATGRDLKGNWKAAEDKTEQAWGKVAGEKPEQGRDARLDRTRERYGQAYDAEGRGHSEDQPLSDKPLPDKR